MTKKLNPIDVLKAVEKLVEQYNALQEELDDCADEMGEALEERLDQVDELKQENNNLKERVKELQENVEGLEHELEQERDTLRTIASDLGTLLSATKRDKADGMRVETYQALRTLKTTLDDLKNDARRLDQERNPSQQQHERNERNDKDRP